jgi:hypothetical protein
MRTLSKPFMTTTLSIGVLVSYIRCSRGLVTFTSTNVRRNNNASKNFLFEMASSITSGSDVSNELLLTPTSFESMWKSNEKCKGRPITSDVERISWGKPAKKKGTGSRGVPHRLNEEERKQFDMAIRKGFLQIHGSGWRKQRRGSPILNSWRNWCDARCNPSIVLHKSTSPESQPDSIIVDLSPLRIPMQFQDISSFCESQILQSNGLTASQYSESEDENEDLDSIDVDNEEISTLDEDLSLQDNTDLQDLWDTKPIYHLSPHYILWESADRNLAKEVCKNIANLFDAPLTTHKKTKKPKHVKHGKSRRHGGYGI